MHITCFDFYYINRKILNRGTVSAYEINPKNLPCVRDMYNFWLVSKHEQKVVAVGWWDGGSLDFLPCSATFNLHPLYLCSYPVFVCSGESYLCKIGRQYFSRQQRRITPEVPSDSLRFLEDCDNKDGSKQKSKRNYEIETLSNCFFFVKSDKFPNSRICQLW